MPAECAISFGFPAYYTQTSDEFSAGTDFRKVLRRALRSLKPSGRSCAPRRQVGPRLQEHQVRETQHEQDQERNGTQQRELVVGPGGKDIAHPRAGQ